MITKIAGVSSAVLRGVKLGNGRTGKLNPRSKYVNARAFAKEDGKTYAKHTGKAVKESAKPTGKFTKFVNMFGGKTTSQASIHESKTIASKAMRSGKEAKQAATDTLAKIKPNKGGFKAFSKKQEALKPHTGKMTLSQYKKNKGL